MGLLTAANREGFILLRTVLRANGSKIEPGGLHAAVRV
jgi:hypothetical protein